MEIKFIYLVLLQVLVLKSQFPLTIGNLISSPQTELCHEHEKSSLLQFKESFVTGIYATNNSNCSMTSILKLVTWTETKDCCYWKGVTCDSRTGHVVSLDVSNSCLYNSLNSTSSLFNLVHLRKLNLADNHFNFSHIPPNMGNLSKLTHLDLSNSYFFGEIPSEISKLTKLIYLNLGSYNNFYKSNFLALKNTNLTSFVKNLTSLEILRLDYIDILSPVPSTISNLTSLIDLSFAHCGMTGEFPIEIFRLPKIQNLDLSSNLHLTGQLPNFHSSSPLQSLNFAFTSFGGKLPTSIGNLHSLELMNFNGCNFSGLIPPSFSNLTQLLTLDLGFNSFTGNIPSSFSSMKNLEYLGLESNNLSGILKLNLFEELKNLYLLILSNNKFSLQTENCSNQTLSSIGILGIGSCNLKYFPSFLSHLDELAALDISSNSISTSIPNWLWNTSFKHIIHLNLSHNKLVGELSPSICELKFLKVLDLSYNAFEGVLPSCFGSHSQLLLALRLKNNNFVGAFPDKNLNSCSLIEMDLSQNLFHGKMPRSWMNCNNLEYVDLSFNQINDTFPYWLESLPDLKVLLLCSNAFHGKIGNPKNNFAFSRLHIIDLSFNSFSGILPSEYFKLWLSMKIEDKEKLQYENLEFTLLVYPIFYQQSYGFSVNIHNKGTLTVYENIQNLFYLMAIDLSNNKFVGTIPESIGDFIGLYSLNLSNNILSGSIPSSLSKLKSLESLDLSHNILSGSIPLQLIDLTFLESFDVSHNHLVGPIPHGNQFDTFQMSSFEGNLGLCGNPLPKNCGTSNELPHLHASYEDDQDSENLLQFDWFVVSMGYASGLVIGVSIGVTLIDTRKLGWLVKIFSSTRIW